MKRLLVMTLALLLTLFGCAPPSVPEPTPVADPELFIRDIHAPVRDYPDPFGCPGFTEATFTYRPDIPMTLDEIAYKLGEMWLNSLMGESGDRSFAITEWRDLSPEIYSGALLHYSMQKNNLFLLPGQYLVNFSAEYKYSGVISIDETEPDTVHKSPAGYTNQIWPPLGSGEKWIFMMAQTGDQAYTLRTLDSCSQSVPEGEYEQYLADARAWLKSLTVSDKAIIAKYMTTDSLVVSAVNLNPPYMDATSFLVSEEPGWDCDAFIVYRRPIEGGKYDFFAPSLYHSENADNCVKNFIEHVQNGNFEDYARINYDGIEPDAAVIEMWRRTFEFYAGKYDLSSYKIESARFAWGWDVRFPGYFYNVLDAEGMLFTLEVEYGDGLIWIHGSPIY